MPDPRAVIHRTERACYCCGRPEGNPWPLVERDKGLVCSGDAFCLSGTHPVPGREGC